MKLNKLKKTLDKWQESELIKVDGQEKQRRIFKHSDEVFKLFGGGESGVLDPFNEYTYEWLHSFFCGLSEWLGYNKVETKQELEDGYNDQINESVDSEVDVYTSGLTEWLNHNVGNVSYLDEVVKQGHTNNILMMAQYEAIYELFHTAFSIILDMIDD